MSAARQQFLLDIRGLADAVSLEAIAAGAVGAVAPPATVILRRGVLVTALVALETFIRDRTVELLNQLGAWPARFEDLPQRLRDASLLDSLSHLQRYARMLKRQQEDYETELVQQLNLMAANRGPVFGFTKFISGDYTGNLSEELFRTLLTKFQVGDCWNAFQLFSADIGYGVPSVRELLLGVVRNRHHSAHSAGFVPTASDVTGLTGNLTCLGICFDAAMTSSIGQALASWRQWSDGNTNWRNGLNIYLLDPLGARYRLQKHGRSRAIRIIAAESEALPLSPTHNAGHTNILITRDASARPISWRLP